MMQFVPQNTVENNRAISLQLVKFKSWVWSGKETKGALPEPMVSLVIMGIQGLCVLRNNVRGFTLLGVGE